MYAVDKCSILYLYSSRAIALYYASILMYVMYEMSTRDIFIYEMQIVCSLALSITRRYLTTNVIRFQYDCYRRNLLWQRAIF